MSDVALKVNGELRRATVQEGESLLHVLRNRLQLTGTRFGCGEEACGACVVLVDGSPTYSCTARAAELEWRTVETVEGLPHTPVGRRLLDAFLAEQAGQCGYCLSGILMSAKALLATNPNPSRDDIVAALDRHLCRCGAHHRILRAVQLAAAP